MNGVRWLMGTDDSDSPGAPRLPADLQMLEAIHRNRATVVIALNAVVVSTELERHEPGRLIWPQIVLP